jgi:hypothetical protein
MSKVIENANTIKKLNLMTIAKRLHPTITEHTLFANTYRTLTMTIYYTKQVSTKARATIVRTIFFVMRLL